jgi:hypothetical protein
MSLMLVHLIRANSFEVFAHVGYVLEERHGLPCVHVNLIGKLDPTVDTLWVI